jgi:hypothetical protein
MSKKKSSKRTTRQAKQSRFKERAKSPAKAKTNRTPLIIGGTVAALAVVLIVGSILFTMNRGADQASVTSGEASNPNSVAAANPSNVKTRYTAVQATDGVINWPLNTFDDGQAHYYSFVDGGKSIDFFVLKSSDGVVRAAFDACDVCFGAHKGYRQQGDLMICNNCGQQFPSVRINEVKGGCNPGPLERTVEGTDLVIRSTDIAAGTGYF